MDWIRRLIRLMSKLARAIVGLVTGTAQPEEQDKILSAEKQKPTREEPKYQIINTNRGEPNAPKKQPRPSGHGWKKRVSKAMGGALYYCNKCRSQFLVPYR